MASSANRLRHLDTTPALHPSVPRSLSSLPTASSAIFVAGYAHTGRQTVRKISESGDHVSFTLRSDNPDGTVQTYQGTAVPRGGDALGLPFGAQLELVFGGSGQHSHP